MKTQNHFTIQKPIFSCKLPVRIYDINHGNHLGHDALISLLHEARNQFLHSHHLSEHDIFGCSWVMTEITAAFKNQAFYGDMLKIELGVQPASKASVNFTYLVSKIDPHSREIIIATAEAKLAFFNYNTQRVQRVPAEFLQLIQT